LTVRADQKTLPFVQIAQSDGTITSGQRKGRFALQQILVFNSALNVNGGA
jgi:hypothetical protein